MSETTEAIMNAAERRIRGAGYSVQLSRDRDRRWRGWREERQRPLSNETLAAAARRYCERFLAEVEREHGVGTSVMNAWRKVFQKVLTRGPTRVSVRRAGNHHRRPRTECRVNYQDN